MVYIGVDLHRKKSQVGAIDQDGKLVLNRKVRTGPARTQLQPLMGRVTPKIYKKTHNLPESLERLTQLGA